MTTGTGPAAEDVGSLFNPFYGDHLADPYPSTGRVASELLSRRLPGLRLAADQQVTWVVNPVHRGPADLRVEWDV